MDHLNHGILALIIAVAICCLAHAAKPVTRPWIDENVPTLFIIGDSTVRNRLPLVGWGDPIRDFFDLQRIHIENDAMAGRSSRTFVTEGRWEAVRAKLHKGDFVLMQFGHNDTKAPISMGRYSLAGLGDETEQGVDPKTKKEIQIHTFGWYMRKMIGETLAGGATPIVLSPVPRCKWEDGKIVRGEAGHGPWAAEIAKTMGVAFIDLNGLIADRYDVVGQPRIKALYFPRDNTHTNLAGAKLNAGCVVIGILQLSDCPLRLYLSDDAPAEAETATEIPTTMPTTGPTTN
ncbi:MAG TPA: rhamnogalacturonan acetylesterase [Tepidisphaeraceae bacterium]|nr:rhamnogalacturonan acetylesterase [Tepidisphaeraceae bacterium]